MKKIIFIIILLYSYCVLYSQDPSTDFSGGSGTQADPYQITTAAQLYNLNNYLGTTNNNNLKHYKLMNDIDLSSSSWVPIASISSPFCGKLHGSGKKIIGLSIGQESTPVTYQYTGLFAVLGNGAYIDSINISSGNIRSGINMANTYTGSISGYASSTTGMTIHGCINNSEISGSSTSHAYIGGIIGYSSSVSNCIIEYCSNNSDISGANESITSSDSLNIGGIIGGAFGNIDTIQYCRNIGNLNASNAHIANVGGIAGYTNFNNITHLQNCYNYCEITNTANGGSGGFVGYAYGNGPNYQFILKQNYAAGGIQSGSQTNVGLIGTIGSNNGSGYLMVQNSIAAQEYINGSTSGTNRIWGRYTGNVSVLNFNNYAYKNMLVNGDTVSTGNAYNENGQNISISQAFSQSFYTSTASWAMTSPWLIREGKGLPYFSGESAPVYISELYRDSLVVDLLNNSDSLIIFEEANFQRRGSFLNQSLGVDTLEFNLLDKTAGDIMIFSNYETQKQPSYPVWTQIEKRTITVTINDTSKCLGSIDPSYTYETIPPLNILPSQDNVNVIGILERSLGESPNSYEITGNLTLNANNSDNYTLSVVPGLLTVLAPDTTSLLTGDYIWFGKNSSLLNVADNWIKFDGSNYEISTTIPDSTSNLFFRSYSNCIDNIGQLSADSTLIVNDITIETSLSLGNNSNLIVYGNWDNTGTFNSSNGSVIFAGKQLQTINPGSGNFTNVLFSNTYGSNADIAITAPMAIEGVATFDNGIIYFENTGSLTFLENSAASYMTSDSFVAGPVTKNGTNEFMFPIGDIQTRDLGNGESLYKILGLIAIPNLQENTTITAEYHFSNENMPDWWPHDGNMDNTIDHVSDREYWTINSSNDINNITFCWMYNEHEENVCIHGFDYGDTTAFNINDLTIAYWNGSKWIDAEANSYGTITHDDGCIQTQTPITFGSKANTYITFASREGENPLPVELLSFKVECSNNNPVLSWETSSETNNDYFIVERSENMVDFHKIIEIPGVGNSITTNTYKYVDNENNQTNNFYYCLKQVDFDGNINLHGYVSSNCYNFNEEDLTLFPNPFIDEFNINLNNPSNKNFSVEIFDMLGQCIFTETYTESNKGSCNINELNNIPASKYLVRVKSNDFVFTKTLVKL